MSIKIELNEPQKQEDIEVMLKNENSGGVEDYRDLLNLPKVNGVTLLDNKTSSDLGLQPQGDYLTQETDPIYSADKPNIALKSEIPDVSGLATMQELSDGLKAKQDKGDYALVSDIPTLLSQFENDCKYTTESEVMQAIAAIPQFKLSIVSELPTTGEKMTLYLVSKQGSNNDVYNEYIWVEQTSSFEFIGTTAVDLTDYAKKTDLSTKADNNAVVHLANNEVITGAKTFTNGDNVKLKVSRTEAYMPKKWGWGEEVGALAVPWQRNHFHDHFAFGLSFEIDSKEVTTDGLNWVSDEEDRDISYLFAQKEFESVVIAPKAGEMGYRFVLYGRNIANSNLEWIEIAFAWTNTTFNLRLIVETSADGVEWVERNSSISTSSTTNRFLFTGYSTGTYLRISIIRTDDAPIDVNVYPLYVKGWSTRKGNQGRGIEFELPCAWDNIPNLFPVKHNVSNLGSTNHKWNNVYANKVFIGNVELDGEKLQKLLALLT